MIYYQKIKKTLFTLIDKRILIMYIYILNKKRLYNISLKKIKHKNSASSLQL